MEVMFTMAAPLTILTARAAPHALETAAERERVKKFSSNTSRHLSKSSSDSPVVL